MSVRYESATNSTLFTECCGCAICDDQPRCPCCDKEIPGGSMDRHEIAMVKLYGIERLTQMRADANKRWAKGLREGR